MSTSEPLRILLVTLLAALPGTSLHAAESPHLGTPLTPAEAAGSVPTVMPDGTGLPPGSGSARAGAVVYEAHCRACHGPGGRGGPNDTLVGGVGTLDGDAPQRTVGSYWPYATTLFDYVQRAMPYTAPGSLSADDVYAVSAYLLSENGIIAPDTVLDARSLPAVAMPNRDGFRRADPAGSQP